MAVYPSSRTQAERTIAAGRVALAVSSLFAVWMDPPAAARYAQASYGLHWTYVAYAVLLAVGIWRWHGAARLPLVTHVIDIITFSVFQYLTFDPSSPFFVYCIFSMFCGALRWGWRGTLATTGGVVVAYLLMSGSMDRTLGPGEDEAYGVIIQTVSLVVVAAMLVYLGRHEARLRSEIERLARWPVSPGIPTDDVAGQIVEHAARILGARRAVLVWDLEEEPTVNVASWSMNHLTVTTHSPEGWTPLLPQALAQRTFLCLGAVTSASAVLVHEHDGRLTERRGLPLPARVLAMLKGTGLASAAFSTERVSGRIFFTDLGTPTSEIVPLTDVIAREIGTSLDQMHVTRHLQEIASREERIRFARDLHDGVLQSLTGIRFELLAVASTLEHDGEATRARLFGLERALAIEQRELRHFIGGLKPASSSKGAAGSLASRLDALRERLALEWKTPVSIRISPDSRECSSELASAVPLMVHEAVVNAMKHAHPTRVNVNVDSGSDRLRIVVSDDGRGFPFKGRYDHRALGESSAAPRSLFDRITALGGKMSIESSDQGSRIEMVVSL